ncbi:MAG: hypothetical protein LUB61_03400 [Eggerthellaceae bacterium]|nr:hypothetical protein [Eggerthellaceae bacterium]
MGRSGGGGFGGGGCSNSGTDEGRKSGGAESATCGCGGPSGGMGGSHGGMGMPHRGGIRLGGFGFPGIFMPRVTINNNSNNSGGGGGGSNNSGNNNDPKNRGPESSKFGCGTIFIIVVVIILVILLIFSLTNFGSCSSSSITESTEDRVALPAGTAEVTPYYTDEDGNWITNPTVLEAGLKDFYDETGVWPYVYILPNGSVTSTSELMSMAEELYNEMFTDSAHFIMVFCDNNNGGYNVGYYMGSAARTVLDDEAIQILSEYLERYYDDYSIDENQIFANTFRDTANRIMSRTIPAYLIVLICIIIIAVIVAIVLIVRWRLKVKREHQKKMEEILNKPLETYSDAKLKDLEDKYKNGGSGE